MNEYYAEISYHTAVKVCIHFDASVGVLRTDY